MKTLIYHICLILLIVGVVGCTTTDPITRSQIDNADYGAYPANYETLIKEFLHRSLIDPNSMMIEFEGAPFKGYCFAALKVPRGEEFGYGVMLRLNAKNQLGGYTGWKTQQAFIRNGRVYDVMDFFGYDANWIPIKPTNTLVPKDSKR